MITANKVCCHTIYWKFIDFLPSPSAPCSNATMLQVVLCLWCGSRVMMFTTKNAADIPVIDRRGTEK